MRDAAYARVEPSLNRDAVPRDSTLVPTSGPRTRAFEMGALATMAGLRDSFGSAPLESCVPTLTDVPPPEVLDLRTAFVLFHVDGAATLREIAEMTDLPMPEATATLMELLALGVVRVQGEVGPPANSEPPSGIYPKVSA